MKIVALTDSIGESAGGLAHATYHLAVAVSKESSTKDISILCHTDSDELDTTAKISDFFQLEICKVKSFRNPVYPLSFTLGKHLQDLNPDIVHLRGLWRQGSFVSLQWKDRFPSKVLIVQPAGMLEPWARSRNLLAKKLFFHFIESKLFDICDYVHATSTAEAQNLIDLGIPSSKVFVIEEGIPLPPVFHRSNSSNPVKTLLFLSRIHPKKGLELLIDAWALVRPVNWKCRIVGMGDSSYIRYLRNKMKLLHISDQLIFEGPLYGESKDYAYQSSHAFILPSYSENFGIAVAEAMSWNLPVITTNQTPWSILTNNNLGWYIEPTINSVSRALFELSLKTDQELINMGSNCRDYVSKKYSWSAIGSKMNKFYDKVFNPS